MKQPQPVFGGYPAEVTAGTDFFKTLIIEHQHIAGVKRQFFKSLTQNESYQTVR